jgi:hypothetical protein
VGMSSVSTNGGNHVSENSAAPDLSSILNKYPPFAIEHLSLSHHHPFT